MTVVRGNASEVLAVARGAGGTCGVDAAHRVEDAAEAAREWARGRAIVSAPDPCAAARSLRRIVEGARRVV